MSDEELVAEINRRGLFDNEGLVKWPVYQLGVATLPIVCVDVIPVKKQIDRFRLGVIIRSTGPEAGKLAVTGGRIKKDQIIVDAISRHLNNDLGILDWQFYSGNDEKFPFFVQQYFLGSVIKDNYGYDPTKHAIALTYLIEISTDPKPKNEAVKFDWIGEYEIPIETAYNHGEAMRQAFRFLSTTK